MYHFCCDNMPAADHNNVPADNHPQHSNAHPLVVQLVLNRESHSEVEKENYVDFSDAEEVEAGDNDNDAIFEYNTNGNASATNDAERQRRIRICIWYQFSKNITPRQAARNSNVLASQRRSMRAEQMLRVKTQNHLLLTLVSTTSQQTCLLNYSYICNFLLSSVEGSSRVFMHRAYSCWQEIKIDTVVWEPKKKQLAKSANSQHSLT